MIFVCDLSTYVYYGNFGLCAFKENAECDITKRMIVVWKGFVVLK